MTDLDHHTLTHLDANGDISMVDVSTKIVTQRSATASAQVIFSFKYLFSHQKTLMA